MKQPTNPKERNLVKGAIRRVFSRSDLRQRAVKRSIVDHVDASRKRVKTWCFCTHCKQYIAKSYMQVDHIIPLIKIDETLEDLTWDEVIERLWCDENNLIAICTECHKAKSKAENKERRKYKKERSK